MFSRSVPPPVPSKWETRHEGACTRFLQQAEEAAEQSITNYQLALRVGHGEVYCLGTVERYCIGRVSRNTHSSDVTYHLRLHSV